MTGQTGVLFFGSPGIFPRITAFQQQKSLLCFQVECYCSKMVTMVTTKISQSYFRCVKLFIHKILSLYSYHFSTVVDLSSEKYSGSTGHRNSWYQERNLQRGRRDDEIRSRNPFLINRVL